ncbi:hypothetical protein [Roseivivax sediminis]|uniref:hypothetical protein n=1 Tax=Roseivivax sediminis TaxID=936889 RepID=UPI001CB6EE75|nr:hypothetical protein [Roseivivax sediminis]
MLAVDEVAKEAGVSKTTVLYEHSSKRDPVAAFVECIIKADNAFNSAGAEGFGGDPDTSLRAVSRRPRADRLGRRGKRRC